MLEITEGARASPAPFGAESFQVATSTDQARLGCGATAIELGPTVSSNETNGLVLRLARSGLNVDLRQNPQMAKING